MQERLFTTTETYLIHNIIKAVTLYAPYIEPKSLFVEPNELVFVWKKLPHKQLVSHMNWWSRVVNIALPKGDEDVKEHLISVVPRFIQQLYAQMDYKHHRLTHILRYLLFHDQYGKYRKQFKQAIQFYRQLRIAYSELKGYNELGDVDGEAQYELRKELNIKYGRAFKLALEIYNCPI